MKDLILIRLTQVIRKVMIEGETSISDICQSRHKAYSMHTFTSP